MKKNGLLILVFVLVSSLLFSGCAYGAQIVARMGHGAYPSNPCARACQHFIDLVEERTDGRVKIEFFHSLALGDDAAMMEQLINGTVEFVAPGAGAFGRYTPLLNVLQLPFLLNNYEKEFYVAQTKELQDIFAAMEPLLGLKILALHESGIRHLSNNIRPIQSFEDVRGLKLRTVPNQLMNDALQALGANPIAIGSFAEVYTGLQNRIMDGLEINKTSVYSQKFYEVLRYFTTVGLWPFPHALTVNLAFFNSLSPEDQKILIEAARESSEYNKSILEEAEEVATKTMIENGMEIIEISDVQPFIDATKDIYEVYMSMDPLMRNFVEMARNLQ